MVRFNRKPSVAGHHKFQIFLIYLAYNNQYLPQHESV